MYDGQVKSIMNLLNRCMYRRGSYTIEASILIPIFLFMMITAVATSVDLYHEAEQAAEQQKTAKIWVVDDFYRLQAVEGVVDQWKE